MYRAVRPTWHAVAWALRKPWAADAKHGPTFNAYIAGVGYWEKFGAQGKSDRVDQRFGPTSVNYKQPDGRMDVTASLTDEAFGTPPVDTINIDTGVTDPGHRAVTANFIEAILKPGTPLICSGEDGLHELELGNAMLYSGLTGEPVTATGAYSREELPALLAETAADVVGVENIWHRDVRWRELPSLPDPVGVAGAFAGAALMEVLTGKQIGVSLKSGQGAAVGRFWGTVSKLAVGVAIYILLAAAAFIP